MSGAEGAGVSWTCVLYSTPRTRLPSTTSFSSSPVLAPRRRRPAQDVASSMAIGKWNPFGTTQSPATPAPVVPDQPPIVSTADAKLFGLENVSRLILRSTLLLIRCSLETLGESPAFVVPSIRERGGRASVVCTSIPSLHVPRGRGWRRRRGISGSRTVLVRRSWE